MNETTTIRTEVYVDLGRVSNAVNTYHDPGGVPYAMWGSGTQALWRLLCSMAYSADTVSLYEVVSDLDASNRRAVVAAVAELCS